MELKRVLGPDSRTATSLAMKQYGKDALIISNERVNGGCEVIVAIDIEAAGEEELLVTPPKAGADRYARGAPPAGPFDIVLNARMEEMRRPDTLVGEVNTAARFKKERMQQLGGEDAPMPDTPPMPVSERNLNSASQRDQDQDKDLALRQQEDSHHQDRQEYDRARELVSMLREEIAQMRKEFRLARQVGYWEAGQGVSDAVRPLVNAMTEAEVPVGLRTLLVDAIRHLESESEAMAVLENALSESIARPKKETCLRGVHVLAGPSGAGKTTMIGRLAQAHAKADVFGVESVAMISFSDHRPGAWSQLQLLGARTGIECFRANNGEILGEVLRELAGHKLVLIDIPGERIAEHLDAIGQVCPAVAAHLLLPADASAATFKRHYHQQGVTWQSLLLSKLDESTHPWPLIQALSEQEVPISFASQAAHLEHLVNGIDTRMLVAAALAGLKSSIQEAAGGHEATQRPEKMKESVAEAVVLR